MLGRIDLHLELAQDGSKLGLGITETTMSLGNHTVLVAACTITSIPLVHRGSMAPGCLSLVFRQLGPSCILQSLPSNPLNGLIPQSSFAAATKICLRLASFSETQITGETTYIVCCMRSSTRLHEHHVIRNIRKGGLMKEKLGN